jgi:prefoldin alpha subunit
MTEEKLNKLAYEARFCQQQMGVLEQQAEVLAASANEIRATMDTLKALSSNKKPSMVPLGSGVYVKGAGVKQDSVLVNIGAGIMAEKSVADAVAFLETRLKSNEELSQKIGKGMGEMNSRLQKIDADARKLVEEMNRDVRASQG